MPACVSRSYKIGSRHDIAGRRRLWLVPKRVRMADDSLIYVSYVAFGLAAQLQFQSDDGGQLPELPHFARIAECPLRPGGSCRPATRHVIRSG